MATKRCLFCKITLINKQTKFCSTKHKFKYVSLSRNHFIKIFPKNCQKKISPFLQDLEKRDKVIMGKEYRIA